MRNYPSSIAVIECRSDAIIDDPELFHNTPIGLQIMGRQLEEEKVLAAALEVQRCIATL